jgi:DNA-binding GntR family transcriptional regulator
MTRERGEKRSSAIGATTAMRVASELRARILSGELKPGQRLKIDDVAELLQISHMPVRGALQDLEAEGILEVYPHRGTVIRGVDHRFVRNMYDVRGAIEGMLAERCAAMISDEQVLQLQQAALAFEQAAERDDPKGIMNANFELHEKINSVADNPDALRVLAQGRLLVEALRVRFGYQVRRVKTIINEHRDIVSAIANRDVQSVGLLARLHCEGARDDLLTLLDESKSG